MRKFRTNSFGIKEFEVVKETDKQVVYLDDEWGGGLRERRESKESDWSSWHNTKEEARQFLIYKEQQKIKRSEAEISTSLEKIEQIKKY